MHDTAFEIGRLFFEIYLDHPGLHILEVGSQNVNGTLRDCAPRESHYTGIDIIEAEGVDIVVDDPYALPFDDDHFDAAIASSCFEHDQMFWLAFLEMVRVTKTGGFIYLNTPSNGSYHSYPFDNWRFYPDAGLALRAWAARQGALVTLVESFVARRKADIWNDCVIIFAKGPAVQKDETRGKVVDHLPDAFNIRVDADADPQNFIGATEDMLLVDDLQRQLAIRESQIASLKERLSRYEKLFSTKDTGPETAARSDPGLEARIAVLEGIVSEMVLNDRVSLMSSIGREKLRNEVVKAATTRSHHTTQSPSARLDTVRLEAERLIPV